MIAPPVKTKQDRTVRVEELPEIVMSRCRFGLTEERLIPIEAARHISDSNDCPRALHRILRGNFSSATSFANWIAWPRTRAQGLHESVRTRQPPPGLVDRPQFGKLRPP